VASSEALDVCYWVMRPALYRRIRLVIEIASNAGVFFCIVNFVVIHILRYRPCYGPYKLKTFFDRMLLVYSYCLDAPSMMDTA
jgi:hypothetical protein